MIEYQFLEELESFKLLLKKHGNELTEGQQANNESGEGMVFKDHKKYTPGDDFKKIDWKAYARTEDLFIRRFEEEKSTTIHILVDKSKSMDYGKYNKYEYANKLGIALAYMTTNTDDRYRYSVFAETLTELSRGRRKTNLTELIDVLNEIPKTPESQIEKCITQYQNEIKHDSTFIIISDLLTDIESIKNTLKRLEGQKIILVSVLDIKELQPSGKGSKIFKDPETTQKIKTLLTPKTKRKYQKKLDNHLDEIEKEAEKNNVEFVDINTSQDVLDSFTKIWHKI